jgi:hypothetical protein
MTDTYRGVELYGPGDEAIGTVAGFMTTADRRQYYVVETGGVLGLRKTRYWVPAGDADAAGSQRIETAVPVERFAEVGWDRLPEDAQE